MAPAFVIHSAENTGPTDNSGDDSLWVVELSEEQHEPERFRFAVARRHGTPEIETLAKMIHQRAAGFDNYFGALAQFRGLEVPHPQDHPWRRVVWLAPEPS